MIILKHLAWLAATSLAAAAVKHWWRQGDTPAGSPRRREEREAVQRWEDEGGLVPAVVPVQRRRARSTARTRAAS